MFIREKKREMLVNGGVSGSSSRASNLDGAVHGGLKGKRSERERNQSRDQSGQNSIGRAGRISLDSSQNENKPKAKKQKSTASGHDRFMEAKESARLPIHDTINNDSKDGATLSGNQDTTIDQHFPLLFLDKHGPILG